MPTRIASICTSTQRRPCTTTSPLASPRRDDRPAARTTTSASAGSAMVDAQELRGDAHCDLCGRFATRVEPDGAPHAIERVAGHATPLETLAEAPPLGLTADEAHVSRGPPDHVG